MDIPWDTSNTSRGTFRTSSTCKGTFRTRITYSHTADHTLRTTRGHLEDAVALPAVDGGVVEALGEGGHIDAAVRGGAREVRDEGGVEHLLGLRLELEA